MCEYQGFFIYSGSILAMLREYVTRKGAASGKHFGN
jgi:hypothetical protein